MKSRTLPILYATKVLTFVCLTLVACTLDTPVVTAPTTTSTPIIVQTPLAIETEIPEGTRTPKTPAELAECLDDYTRRELKGSIDGDRRYSLSSEELTIYLDLMGIDSLCIPVGFGVPFLNVDWNELDDPLIAIGRMVSIGFEELLEGGGGWGRGYLVYSTYDFEVGTMYHDFATFEDLDALRSGSMPDMIHVDGVDGFVRFFPGFRWQTQEAMKTVVFPFDSHYVAVVLALGEYDPVEIDDILNEMATGRHPDLTQEFVLLMDLLASSIQFK
jgi:hypothetical protein